MIAVPEQSDLKGFNRYIVIQTITWLQQSSAVGTMKWFHTHQFQRRLLPGLLSGPSTNNTFTFEWDFNTVCSYMDYLCPLPSPRGFHKVHGMGHFECPSMQDNGVLHTDWLVVCHILNVISF